jgi:hypothetical protein
MKYLLTTVLLCYSLACFSQVKADTLHLQLKAVDDYDIENQVSCGVIKNVISVPFTSLTETAVIKVGDKIDLHIICPEFYKRLKNIEKDKTYSFKIYHQYVTDQYGEKPGYYLDEVE